MRKIGLRDCGVSPPAEPLLKANSYGGSTTPLFGRVLYRVLSGQPSLA